MSKLVLSEGFENVLVMVRETLGEEYETRIRDELYAINLKGYAEGLEDGHEDEGRVSALVREVRR